MYKVSVIVPNYNHSLFLQQRIDSILHQTCQDFELIILDDCSTDNSKEVIESYRQNPKVTEILYNSVNSGSPFIQWEKGIKQSTGKFIWIAESDDWAEESFLEKMLEVMELKENTGICFCNSHWVDQYGNKGRDLSIYQENFERAGREEINDSLVRFNSIQNASAVIMRSDLAKKYIQNISKFKTCGDWYFYINILQESNLVYNNQKLNNFRWYHANTSNSAEKNGLWLTEGLQVLAYSNAYKNNFSYRQLVAIASYWKEKISKSSFNNVGMNWCFYRMMALFFLRSFSFKLVKL